MDNSKAPELDYRKNSKISDARFFYPPPFGEVAGILEELDEADYTATISSYVLRLPMEVITSLKPHLGRRITLLRTDDVARPYLWRLLSQT